MTPTVTPLDPAVAIGPHPRDPQRLLLWWTVRRVTFALLFLGLIVGMVVAGAKHEQAEVYVDTSSPEHVLGGVLSTFGVAFAAIVLRIAVRWIALAQAYPLARLHQAELGGGPDGRARTVRRRLERAYDRLGVARAFRELRWTDGVLGEAESRLGPGRARYERVGRVVGIVNACAVVAFVVSVARFGFTIEM